MQNQKNSSNTNASRLPREEELFHLLEELYGGIPEAEETLSAIRRGEVDAFLVSTDEGEKIYTLKTAEHPYRVLIEQMREGAALLSIDGTILFSNISLAHLLAMPLEKLIGESIHTFIAPAGAASFQKMLDAGNPAGSAGENALQAHREGKVPVHLSLRLLSMEGTQVFSLVATDMTERKQAEETLQRAYGELEDRVRERTAELAESNVRLRAEVEERKRAEEKLRESEERYRSVFATSHAVMLIIDPETGDIVDANPAASAYYGYPRDGLTGMKISEINMLDEDAVHAEMQKAKTGEQHHFSFRHRLAGGEIRDVDVYSGIIVIHGRRLLHSIIHDVTDRRRAEEALRESEEKYARFFWDDLTGDSLASADGQILACNPAFLAIFGFSSFDEALASNIQSLYPDPGDRADILHLLQKERVLYHHALILRRRDGRLVNIVANMVGVFDDAGELVGTQGYMYDDTDRKRAEDILKESEERYRILVELSPDAILLEQDNRFTYANPAAVRLFRASSPEDFAGKSTFDLVHPDYHALIDTRTREILAKGSVPPVEIKIVRFDGQDVYVESSRALVPHKGKPASIRVMRDITRRKQAEEALLRHTQDLNRLNRELKTARDEANLYLDILTHDVRNANNVSMMYADLILDMLKGDPKTYAQKLHNGIWRSNEILQNVATIRRIHEGSTDLSPIDLDAAIRKEIGSFPAASIRYEGQPIEVCADGLLPVIFTNLIGNAVKFGGPDVEITILVEERDGEVLVSVEDTGPGIPDEIKEKLFHRFERGQTKASGQGLGLYICRTLIERYGGRVWVEDRVPGHPEEGAAFRFTLQDVTQHGHVS
ncbi:PAS domain S-box protein [Methanoculleus sp.]|uniref:PAS domain-containing protein n=1 Tax=Methanoculleus sp. TaxID=90427 RepID=UPI001BD35B79|nr:PAS domain S-box protein [Methanoculleus sp.]